VTVERRIDRSEHRIGHHVGQKPKRPRLMPSKGRS
jgi:hypothetical protein